MIIDLDTVLLEPVYLTWSNEAVFTDKDGKGHVFRYLDHRDGTNLTAARGYSGSMTMLPRGMDVESAVVMIRKSECPAKPIGWTVVLPSDDAVDGETLYKVVSCRTKGRLEWVCTLEEA